MGLRELFSFSEKIRISSKNLPKHIALTVEHVGNEDRQLLMEATASNFKSILQILVKLNIPIVSVYFHETDSEFFSHLFQELYEWTFLNENQIKVSVVGKWYSLPAKCIDEVKSVLNLTKDYDRFFLNLCVSYDGQEEIVDACKLIAMQVKSGKLDPDKIDKTTIKENIYASYFLPPNLIITTGLSKQLRGFLLWDSAGSKVYFSNKNWLDFTRSDLLRGIEYFQEGS